MKTIPRNKNSGWIILATLLCALAQPAFAATTYSITPNPATVSEGAGTLTFTITRSGGTPAETIYVSTSPGEGFPNNSDYTGILNQTVSFTAGQLTRTVTVTILNDTTTENNETFGFLAQRNSTDPASTYLAKATFTITDNDVQPTAYAITPNPATVNENVGTLTFTITRSGGTPAETIYVSTTTSTEGYPNNGDYTGILNQTVSFTAGQTTRTVTVTISDDSTVEGSETFGFIAQRNSTDPATTYLAKSTFTITDNDVQPTTYAITPNPATVNENVGTLTFTITRSGGTPAETIYASTSPGEGYPNNSDYTGILNQTVSFTAGQTTRTVTVTISDDSTVEGSETFGFLAQRNSTDPATTYLAKATFTITDNDVQPTAYAITPNPATVNENVGTLTFTITRSGGTPAETIYVSTTTSTEGYPNNGDYTGILNQTVSFTAGQTTRTVTVTISDDSTVEGSETFGFIAQRNSTDPATTYLAKSTFTITDNDVQPTTYAITPNPATVNENVGTLTFTITRSGGTPAETIYASTSPGEGYPNNSDYTGILNQTVSFTAGQTTRTVTVTISDDSTVEGSETFGFLAQRNSTDPATTYLAKSTFTITDNDVGLSAFLVFPLAGFTAYNNKLVTAVFDHYSGGVLTHQVTSTAADNIVEAFNGEHAEKIFGDNGSGAYKKDFLSTPVTLDGIYKYTGTAAQYLQYDGHRGIDFGVAEGTAVFAAAGGTVDAAGWENDADHNQGFGLRVRLSHGNGYYTYYGHLSSISVSTGAIVAEGDPLGFSGTTGSSTAPHLHFEVRNTTTLASIDPYGYQGIDVLWKSGGVQPTAYAITPNPATVNENVGTLTFTITRSGGTPAETIYVSTTTSTEGYPNNGDYTGILNQTVSFTAGQTTRTVTVTISDDSTVEGSETFGFIAQRNSTDPATTYLAKSTFTITDNDVQPTTYAITPNPATVNENVGTLTFTITRSGGTPAETIYASTSPGEGYPNNSDYTGILNQTVSFTAGQTTRTVTVTISDDSTVEGSETFGFLAQRNSTDPATTYLAKSTFTITDNDESGTLRHGVDYSFSHPEPDGLKAAGYDFAVRYVSGSGAPKNLTLSEAQALRAAGIDIIVIFESTAGRILDGYSAGVADGHTAVAVATAAGAPQNFFCYFACDIDATLNDQTAINAYLDGAASALGGVQRVGLYAGYWPLSRALDAGKASKGWQTTAWSGGNKDPRISLYQHTYDVTIAGGLCDINDGYGADLGQWSFAPVAATPTITPPGGNFNNSVQVALASTTSGATIRYTTDGSNPTGTSPIYTVPFTLTSSATVKAKAFASGYSESADASANFTVTPTPTVATPTISPAGGNFSGSVQVTLASTTSGATIRYTTDGSNPTTGSPVYIVPFTLTSSATVKAKAFASGNNDSAVASAGFTVTPVQTVATPTITPAGGSFIGSVQVTLACTTSGATIRFTTDGNDPTSGSPGYTAPFTLTSLATVKAKAFANGYNDSAIATASFTVTPPTVATPTMTPAGGSFNGSVQVALACATAGSAIRYTTDGSNPTSGSALYTSPFTLTSSATVKAKAFASGYTDSDVASAGFSIVPISTVATPSIAPSGGSFNGSVQVALACATSEATIRYTTDGNDPTGASPIYTGPFTLSSSGVVKARGFASGFADSAIASASFTIIPLAITGIGGGPVLPPNSGVFQLEVHSSQPQVTVQVSDDMVHWIDVGTFNIVDGKAYFVDGSAGANAKRFYRLKP